MGEKMTEQYIETTATDKTTQGSFNGSFNAGSNTGSQSGANGGSNAGSQSGSNGGTNAGTRKKRGVFGALRSSAKSEQDDVTKDLHKLTRTELLEMLVDETKEADRLRAENRRLRKELERAREDLDRAASLSAVIAKLEEIVERAGRQN